MLIFRDEKYNLIVQRGYEEEPVFAECAFYRRVAKRMNELLGTELVAKRMNPVPHDTRYYLCDRMNRYYFSHDLSYDLDNNYEIFNDFKAIQLTFFSRKNPTKADFLIPLPLWDKSKGEIYAHPVKRKPENPSEGVYLVVLRILSEYFGKDKDGQYPYSWESNTRVVPFLDMTRAHKYLDSLKSEYSDKGKIVDDFVSGMKSYTSGDKFVRETINACVRHTTFGDMLMVAEDNDGGEWPYSNDGLLSCHMNDIYTSK